MFSKFIGGVLLIVGTTIGAGMLALPIANAELGFFGSVLLLIACWSIMTACAFLFLEVNLWLPPHTNLVSMAGATLGRSGQIAAWIIYLFLLYSIMSAYIAGGGDLFKHVLSHIGLNLSFSLALILFTALFGFVVYLGIRSVDYVNRGLMFGKMGAFFLLVLCILPFMSANYLTQGELKYFFAPTGISVTIVAFGCLMIIPSLRPYFNNDIKTLRKVIFIGTLIPLLCYIAWDMVIMGVIPIYGDGLKSMAHSDSSNSDLVKAVTMKLQSDFITVLTNFFTSICMATSFLSVSLSLSDFVADGIKIGKRGLGNIIIYGITFLPPIVIVLFYPDAFIRGLSYAGIGAFLLMVLMPPLMAWRGRYHCGLATENSYQVKGGKLLLVIILLFGTIMLGFSIKGVLPA